MNYTKGEWTINPNDNQRGVYGIYAPKGRGRICTITNRNPKDELANAHLITASPDMYEALKEALYQWKQGNIEIDFASRVLMDKALAKAEEK